MDSKKEAKKYLNKFFKQQHFTEDDHEFKSLVRLLNKAQSLQTNESKLSTNIGELVTVPKNCSCGREFYVKTYCYICDNDE